MGLHSVLGRKRCRESFGGVTGWDVGRAGPTLSIRAPRSPSRAPLWPAGPMGRATNGRRLAGARIDALKRDSYSRYHGR